jgi:hypothetical protein
MSTWEELLRLRLVSPDTFVLSVRRVGTDILLYDRCSRSIWVTKMVEEEHPLSLQLLPIRVFQPPPSTVDVTQQF